MNYQLLMYTLDKLEKSTEDAYILSSGDYNYIFTSIAKLSDDSAEMEDMYNINPEGIGHLKHFVRKYKSVYPFVSRRKYNKVVSKCICWVLANILEEIIRRSETRQLCTTRTLNQFRRKSGNFESSRLVENIKSLPSSRDVIIVEPEVVDM